MKSKERISTRMVAAMEIYAGLPPTALKRIASAGQQRWLPAGTRIFRQGDGPVRAHVVIEGGVRILQTGGDGAQAVMRLIAPGEMFGTVALFTDGRYPADAIALVDTLEASWSEHELVELIHRYPTIGVNALRIVGKRLQEVQNRVRELATQSATRRIAHALMRLVHQCGSDTSNGVLIAFPLRRKDVADLAGTTLYTASRILTGWEDTGLLTTHRRHLTVCKPDELQAISESSAPAPERMDKNPRSTP